MTDELAFSVAVFASVFAIVDPIGMLPFYAALTEGLDPAERRLVVNRSALVLAGVLASFALVGRFLFAAYGFTLEAFEIAGGILLFIVAYEMLTGEVTRTKMTDGGRVEATTRADEIAVFPLGIPLLAGPGAISTVMIYEGTAGSNPIELLATFVAIGLTAALSWAILRFSDPILRRLGRVGVMAISRVMGLLLAAVGVQFVIDGLVQLVPHLSG